jgi:hypothetical protein
MGFKETRGVRGSVTELIHAPRGIMRIYIVDSDLLYADTVLRFVTDSSLDEKVAS